jgi:epoxyqueuosine reductase QueG
MTEDKNNHEKLKELSTDFGFSLFGVADIAEIKHEFNLPKVSVEKFSRGIVLGKRLLDAVIEEIVDRPTALYFHHYRQLNFFLDRGAFLVASKIQELGFQALPIPASQITDWKKQQSHVSHKKVGYLAGLGWIGRNNLLVNPDLGSRARLVTILTDMPLATDNPLDLDCGSCRACIGVCPAKAIHENVADFDHWLCFDKLKEFRNSGVVGQHICGVCIKACPGFNRKKR